MDILTFFVVVSAPGKTPRDGKNPGNDKTAGNEKKRVSGKKKGDLQKPATKPSTSSSTSPGASHVHSPATHTSTRPTPQPSFQPQQRNFFHAHDFFSGTPKASVIPNFNQATGAIVSHASRSKMYTSEPEDPLSNLKGLPLKPAVETKPEGTTAKSSKAKPTVPKTFSPSVMEPTRKPKRSREPSGSGSPEKSKPMQLVPSGKSGKYMRHSGGSPSMSTSVGVSGSPTKTGSHATSSSPTKSSVPSKSGFLGMSASSDASSSPRQDKPLSPIKLNQQPVKTEEKKVHFEDINEEPEEKSPSRPKLPKNRMKDGQN